MNISTCYFMFLFLVFLGFTFHEAAVVISIESFHGRTEVASGQLWSSWDEIGASLVICDGLEKKRKTRTKRAIATIVWSSTKEKYQRGGNRLWQMCNEKFTCRGNKAADGWEPRTSVFLVSQMCGRSRCNWIYNRNPGTIPNNVEESSGCAQKSFWNPEILKILGNSQVILLAILRRGIIKVV